jgi:cytochrome b561
VRTVVRYHSLLAALHWIVAVLIVGMLAFGFFWLAPMANVDPHKIGALQWHMAIGMLIFTLTIVRLIVRVATAKPGPAWSGFPVLDRVTRVFHYSLYLLIVLMAASGMTTAVVAGLNRIVFQASGEPLPPAFASYPSFVIHAGGAFILVGLIGVHVVAALYHQFVRKDRLLSRMWFGRRRHAALAPAE